MSRCAAGLGGAWFSRMSFVAREVTVSDQFTVLAGLCARKNGKWWLRPSASGALVRPPGGSAAERHPNWYFRKVLMVARDAPRLCMRQTTWWRRGLMSFPGMPLAAAERGQDARGAPTGPGETRFCATMLFRQRY